MEIHADRPAQDKHIILIRHAESTNNVAKSTLKRMLHFERRPRGDEWWQLASLLSFPMDTPLSAAGEAMLREQRAALDAQDFLSTHRIELVLHSPLQRARETAVGLFGGGSVPLVEDPGIYEKDLAEHAGLRSLEQRTRSFSASLLARPEKRVVVVGHSAHFRALFAEGDGFDKSSLLHGLLNVSVWSATLSAAEANWSDLKLLVPGWPRPVVEAAQEAMLRGSALVTT